MSNIYFHELKISGLKNRTLLKKFIHHIFNSEKKKCDRVDIIFCSDPYILNLNKKFLDHNYYTDTLTFVLEKNPLIGEIYISIDRIKENSKFLKIRYQNELLRVIIHSCLHLCGYQDDKKGKAIKMFNKQESYLDEWPRFT